MSNKSILGILAAVLITLGGVGALWLTAGQQKETAQVQRPAAKETHAEHADPHAAHRKPHAGPTPRIPAFQIGATEAKLPKTLSPDLFAGSARTAYQVALEIPETLAGLPCYCHCDRGFGHKSLHSCFIDDHGANCSICINTAIKAHKLQKEQKMSTEEIREKIIAEYSKPL